MSLDNTPQRVVSLQPSATVILSAIGKLDRLVACTKYCVDVCPEVATGDRSIIADSWTAKADEILAAAPDLVIAAVPYQEKAVIEILKSETHFLGLAQRWRPTLSTVTPTTVVLLVERRQGEQVLPELS